MFTIGSMCTINPVLPESAHSIPLPISCFKRSWGELIFVCWKMTKTSRANLGIRPQMTLGPFIWIIRLWKEFPPPLNTPTTLNVINQLKDMLGNITRDHVTNTGKKRLERNQVRRFWGPTWMHKHWINEGTIQQQKLVPYMIQLITQIGCNKKSGNEWYKITFYLHSPAPFLNAMLPQAWRWKEDKEPSR